MAVVINTEIPINRKLLCEISYVEMVLRKMLHSCEYVDIQPIQTQLVREILHEDTTLSRIVTFPLIIARDGSSQVFQPNLSTRKRWDRRLTK